MPELPEVEIHARNLREWLVGRTVRRAALLDPLLDPDSTGWAAALAGRAVREVAREAKHLLIHLSGGSTLLAHLRMTGRFLRDAYCAGEPAPPTRFVLDLDDGTRVRFEDRRRFGRLRLEPTARLAEDAELARLGPDALLCPTTPDRLGVLAAGSRRPIKALLMDQRLLGGLGNICAIEILYRCGLHPDEPAGSLGAEAVARLAGAIPPYLEWAIRAQSRRELIYLGEKGAENVFSIYRREGTPCPACGAAIVRTVTAGRGTWWCPGCQPRRNPGPTGAGASAPPPPGRTRRSARAREPGTPAPPAPRAPRRGG